MRVRSAFNCFLSVLLLHFIWHHKKRTKATTKKRSISRNKMDKKIMKHVAGLRALIFNPRQDYKQK